MIKFVKHKDIDITKWDELVSNSYNGFIYASSSHLDIVSGNWNAVILNDYEAVMPLPEKTKFGVRYIMQPMFSQQLGIIYKYKPDNKCVNDFIIELQNNYKFFALNLNFDNDLCIKINNIEYVNQVLHLNKSYEEISSNYSKNTKRNLKSIDLDNLEIKQNFISTDSFIDLYKENLPNKKLIKYIETAEKLVSFYSKNKAGNIYSVHNKTTNTLIACVLILSYNKRHIYLLPVSSKEGKEQKAMFFLIDNFIKEKSNSNFLLDFEGSNFENIKRFYKGFGAEFQNYTNIYNKLFSL